MDELREQHDQLLASKPDSMSEGEFAALLEDHKPNCPFCNTDFKAQLDIPEGGDMEKTFSQEELEAAVSAAVAPIQAELESLKDSAEQSVVDTRVAEAQAEADIKVAEIQDQLEAAVLDAGNARAELANLIAFLEGEKEASELAELAEAIRSDRKAKVEEASSFTPEFIEANLDRWCAESDDDFAARVAEWEVSSVKVAEKEVDESASLDTAMTNVRPVSTDGKIAGDLANFLSGSTTV